MIWNALREAPEYFGEAAMVDPLSGGLLLVGNAILFFSIAVMGILALGAVLAALRPE